ncbi:MAG: hypothetical protein WA269_06265 [Candidatus Udaeobacter sp.]
MPDGCTIRCVAAGSDVLDPKSDDIAPAKLAVDRQIEHGKVASATFQLEFRPYQPDPLGPVCPGQLFLVPRHSLGRGGRNGHTPRLGY